ncbi:carbonic anhydrase [Pseudonocardia sp.]|jgi:carbonic anhydrase|uniref:beta-class carbonic anhydrase n=1 Tax=Pseudonocardia sp. TaxID=60912 RepID=UPI0031FDFE1D
MSNEELLRRYEAGGGRLAASNANGVAVAPALRTVVLTCMDSRIDVFALFGLALGEVHVLRNAGGVVTDDAVRSLSISQRKLGTRDVLVMQHSGCGLATFTDEEFSEELAVEVGMRPPWRTHAFADPAVNVRRGVARLRHDPFLLPETVVRGFVLDIESFTLTEIGPHESHVHAVDEVGKSA